MSSQRTLVYPFLLQTQRVGGATWLAFDISCLDAASESEDSLRQRQYRPKNPHLCGLGCFKSLNLHQAQINRCMHTLCCTYTDALKPPQESQYHRTHTNHSNRLSTTCSWNNEKKCLSKIKTGFQIWADGKADNWMWESNNHFYNCIGWIPSSTALLICNLLLYPTCNVKTYLACCRTFKAISLTIV